jgi:hypothetical protein
MTGLEVAAVMAAAQAIGGLLGSKSAADQRRAAGIQQAMANQFSMEQEARKQQQQEEQGAISNLVEAYRSALVGG